jgi:CheY-like chemotaxis protein
MDALRKVLVVDDDPVVRQSFSRVLSSKGYAVITAESGEEALRKLNEEKYDAVYTDIRMPGMSGLDVAEQVKARRPWTPVVIITGYGSDAAETRAKAAGVSSFLHKPLSPEMIETSARNVLAEPAVPEGATVLAVAEAPVAEEPAKENVVKNVLLFFAAPFIGLAYIIALPFVGLAALAMIAGRAAGEVEALNKIGGIAKHGGLLLVAPFVGLAYVTVFPFIALGMLVWMGGRALIGAGRRSD